MFIMYLQGKTYINKTSSSLRLVCCQQCWCWLSDWTYLQQCIFRRLWSNWCGEIIIQVTMTLVLQRVCECECEWGFLVNNQSCASVIGVSESYWKHFYRYREPICLFRIATRGHLPKWCMPICLYTGGFYLWLVDVGNSRLPQPAICGTLLVEP